MKVRTASPLPNKCNATGLVEQWYSYDHFGKRTINEGDGTTERTVSSHKILYGYTSRRHEKEAGLMYFRARYYDPATGEFISRDPLEYVDGMSLYRGYFVPEAMDPLGLQNPLDDFQRDFGVALHQFFGGGTPNWSTGRMDGTGSGGFFGGVADAGLNTIPRAVNGTYNLPTIFTGNSAQNLVSEFDILAPSTGPTDSFGRFFGGAYGAAPFLAVPGPEDAAVFGGNFAFRNTMNLGRSTNCITGKTTTLFRAPDGGLKSLANRALPDADGYVIGRTKDLTPNNIRPGGITY